MLSIHGVQDMEGNEMSHFIIHAGIRKANREATRTCKFGIRERETGTLGGAPNMGGHGETRTVWKDPKKVEYTWKSVQDRRTEGDPLMRGGFYKEKPICASGRFTNGKGIPS